MELVLTDEEATALYELLDRHLGDLTAEISHTDNPTFRQGLRHDRELLRHVHALLAAAMKPA